jgi:hypothetical protein
VPSERLVRDSIVNVKGLVVTIAAAAVVTGRAGAQGVRVTGVSALQVVDVRPLVEDSVTIGQASGTGPYRLLPDGTVVRCVTGEAFCRFLSSGDRKTAAPLVQDLRAGRGSAGKLIPDDRMYDQLTALLTASEQVAAHINRGRGSLGRMATDPTLLKTLEPSIKNLEAVTGKIRSGEGSLGKLLNDDAMAKSLTATTGNLETLTGRLNKGEGTAGKLFTDQELYNRLNSNNFFTQGTIARKRLLRALPQMSSLTF